MKLSFILPLFFIATLVNCSKHTIKDSNVGLDFPNTVGSYFNYAVIDSNSGKPSQSYTVNIAIVGLSTLPDSRPVTIWKITTPTTVDTNYVFSDKDSAIFYDKTKLYITNIYHSPLRIADKWSKPYKRDTLTVINNGPLSTTSGAYTNAFLIQEHGSAENYYFNKYQWFVPKVGMVRMYFQEYYFLSPVTHSWELVSYHIN